MAAVIVLAKRNYIMILTPSVTREMAHKEKTERRIKDIAKNTSIGAEDALRMIKDAIAEGEEHSKISSRDLEKDQGDRRFFYYNPKTDKKPGSLSNYERDEEVALLHSFRSGTSDTQEQALMKDDRRRSGIVWMINNFGLGGRGHGARKSAARETVYDILRLTSLGALPSNVSDVDPYLRSLPELAGLTSDSAMDAFKAHLLNHLGEQEISFNELGDVIRRRIIGVAMSTSCGSGDATTQAMAPTLDINVGAKHV
jgi:hypothetical protein